MNKLTEYLADNMPRLIKIANYIFIGFVAGLFLFSIALTL